MTISDLKDLHWIPVSLSQSRVGWFHCYGSEYRCEHPNCPAKPPLPGRQEIE